MNEFSRFHTTGQFNCRRYPLIMFLIFSRKFVNLSIALQRRDAYLKQVRWTVLFAELWYWNYAVLQVTFSLTTGSNDLLILDFLWNYVTILHASNNSRVFLLTGNHSGFVHFFSSFWREHSWFSPLVVIRCSIIVYKNSKSLQCQNPSSTDFDLFFLHTDCTVQAPFIHNSHVLLAYDRLFLLLNSLDATSGAHGFSKPVSCFHESDASAGYIPQSCY